MSIKATGRGTYQRTRLDAFGFPRGYLTRNKAHFGFATGDLVIAKVFAGKNTGIHIGRVAIRATGRFNVRTAHGLVQGIFHKHCRLLQRADGYEYSQIAQKGEAGTALSLPGMNAEVSHALG